MRKTIVTAIFAALALLIISQNLQAKTKPKQNAIATSFEQQCKNKSILSVAAQKTITELLNITETQNCNRANEILQKLTELYIANTEIIDVEAIVSFTNLTDLYLENSQIEDVRLLARLTNLSQLSLRSNQIKDIQPLASLRKLTVLILDYAVLVKSYRLN